MTTPTMRYRTIGDLSVSALGLGCMGMSFAYGPADSGEARATLERALELGLNFFDTADIYGMDGANEKLLSTFLSHHRSEVVLATKFGIVTDPDTGRPAGVNGSPAYVRSAVEASLARLGTDVIDLYYLHRVDPDIPIEETVGAMAALVAQGKVRHLGISEASADTLLRASTVHPITALQSEWSVFSRDIETADVAAARQIGAAIVPYSPLGRGMLTGSAAALSVAADDFRSTLPRWQPGNLETNRRLVAQIGTIAAEVEATPGQVALAWLLAQGYDVVPIPGTKRRTYLEENVGALAVTLSPEQLSTLSALRPVGDRYPDMTWVAGESVSRAK